MPWLGLVQFGVSTSHSDGTCVPLGGRRPEHGCSLGTVALVFSGSPDWVFFQGHLDQ